jgi:formylglycine-generating enzyme required for sulfatase activity
LVVKGIAVKNRFVLVAAFLILGSVMVGKSQVTLAGGGATFNVSTFPRSNAQSCGTWQAGNYGGFSNGKWLDPCLPPSQSVSAAIVPTANGTPQPDITLAGTQLLSLHGTGTPVNFPAQTPYANFGCSSTSFGGVLSVVRAPYIRATVNMSSNSGPVLLGSGTVALTSVSYNFLITYPPQAPGTHLILTIGQWDGTKYVGPSTQLTGDCAGPTPTYNRPAATTVPPTPTVVTSPAPVPTTGAPISFGIQQVYVPAGCFMMGKDVTIGSPDNPDEQPKHQVCITKSYWLDEFDVTNAAFDAFAKAGGYTNDNLWSKDGLNWKQSNNISGPGNKDYYNSDCSAVSSAPNQPRVCVAYYEAEAYARWRTCRLPTEAEWEYAARGPKDSIYPWGDIFDPIDYENKANMDDRIGKTTAVDAYPLGRSWVGAYDMLGNVYQWVADLYDPSYYTYRIQNDPTGPTSGQFRVIRGTPWYNPKNVRIHASLRSASRPDRFVSIGFRVACSAPNSASLATATPTYIGPRPTVVFGPAPNVYIGCASAIVNSTNTVANAPYIRAIVTWTSNTNNVLAEQVQPLVNNAYNIHLSYSLQTPGRNLAVTVGAWDGTNFITRPLSLLGNCITPTPDYTVPSPMPTLVLTAVSPQISIAAFCDGVTIQGSSDRPQINIALISMTDGSIVGVATSWVENGQFLITVPFSQSGTGPFLSLPIGTPIMVKLSVPNQDGSSESQGQFETTVACNR